MGPPDRVVPIEIDAKKDRSARIRPGPGRFAARRSRVHDAESSAISPTDAILGLVLDLVGIDQEPPESGLDAL
jgi:hypothetical protein